ncbi:hypothetical protein D1BOALGB6SA_5206 [Olavius sp. associated proteobacterium Delta 1]|nr:hypothetical protein D1BOALGB6SA_5206 [Olavius sp. associated proteobacterium Delta 1]
MQTGNLYRRRSHQRKDLTLVLNEIKRFRKEMRETFIGVVA